MVSLSLGVLLRFKSVTWVIAVVSIGIVFVFNFS